MQSQASIQNKVLVHPDVDTNKLKGPDNIFFDHDVLMVNPASITHGVCKEFSIYTLHGVVQGGNWDKDTQVFAGYPFNRSLPMRMRGVEWEETPYFKYIADNLARGGVSFNCRSTEDIHERCALMDEYFSDMRENGYRQHPAHDHVTINIGRMGELLFNNGRHRLAMAQVLGIPEIPVKVSVRHSRWASFKAQIEAYAEERERLYAPVTHVDLAHLPSWHNGRFELFKQFLRPGNKTLLDIGAHWGYMCQRFEELGLDCAAVEYSKPYMQVLERLRIAGGYKFRTVFEDVFEFTEREQSFDVVLALRIFHHFIKNREEHDKLAAMLQRLEMREMFFQPQLVSQGQMKGAYANYSPEEFVEFILDNSCLDSWTEIEGGNERMFHLYRS